MEGKEEEKREQELQVQFSEKYEGIISKLPKEKSMYCADMYQYEGFWYEFSLIEGVLWVQQEFEARSTDIVVATFPKCGTTWLDALVFAILNRQKHDPSSHPLLTKGPHECVPFLELQVHNQDPISQLDSLPSPRTYTTHIAHSSLPKSVFESGCKFVCISRDPKDVIVSTWMFCNKIRSGMNLRQLSIEEVFDSFCKGKCASGPYWDHVLGYWEASMRCPERYLFLRYEDLKRDTPFYVKKLASFLGVPFSMEEEQRGALQELIHLCSFKNLNSLEVNKKGLLSVRPQINFNVENSSFFRKGEVGDWKNHLTKEMVERLDSVIERKMKDTDFKF